MKKRINILAFIACMAFLGGCSLLEEVVFYETPLPNLSSEEGSTDKHESAPVYKNPVEQTQTQTEKETTAPRIMELPDGMHLTMDDVYVKYEYAYLTGDLSFLDERERVIFSNAYALVSECTSLDSYTRVNYVHDYLVASVSYEIGENAYNEYGALVEKKAVCQGYAYAFKLCMDLLGIDCITVGGTADNGQEILNHAWNMVNIDGKWYHVDVTWDDPDTNDEYGAWSHMYLMADDEFMQMNHSWTDIIEPLNSLSEMPVATDPSQHYYKKIKKTVYSQEELEKVFVEAFKASEKSIELLYTGFEPDYAFVSRYTSCILLRSEGKGYTNICFKIN